MPDSNGNGPNNVLIQKLGTNVGMGRISCSHGDERRQPQPSSMSNSMIDEDEIRPVLMDHDKPSPKPAAKINFVQQVGKIVKAQAVTKAFNDKAKMKEVLLTFHNLNQNTVHLYVKNSSFDEEEFVKVMLPTTMFTVEKGKAFAYQEWLVKIEKDDEVASNRSEIEKITILRFQSQRNMHVKIPNGTAMPIPWRDSLSGEQDEEEKWSQIRFTNNLREFVDVYDVDLGLTHQMRPNQALQINTQRGNHLIVKNNQDMEIFTCFGSSHPQEIQVNQSKMHHLKRLDSRKKINLHTKLQQQNTQLSRKKNLNSDDQNSNMDSQGSFKSFLRKKSTQNFGKKDEKFIFDTLDSLKETVPMFYPTDNMIETICLTSEHYIMYFDQETNHIKQHDIKTDQSLPEIDINLFTKSQVTRIVKSLDEDRTYSVGCLDGSVHLLNTIDLSPVAKIIPTWKNYTEVRDSMQVNDIYADEKIVAVVHQNGVLALYKRTSQQVVPTGGPIEQEIEDIISFDCIFSRQFDSPLKSIKVSTDCRYMVAYCEHRGTDENQNQDDEYLEFLVLYDLDNLTQPRWIDNVELNLDDNEQYSENPSKLYKFFNQNQSLLIRSVDMLGVEEIILEEGRTKDTIENMHSKPILDILLLKDEKTLITAGRDTKICVWNLNRKMLVDTMIDHKTSVTALAMSSDERFMVSGSADGVIIVWLAHNWVKLCELDHDKTLVDVVDVMISKDNNQVIAVDSCGIAVHWEFKSDEIDKDSKPLKISQEQIKTAIISADQRFLAVLTQTGIKIWDMEKDEVQDLSRDFENYTHKGVKFSYNSKYLFFCSQKNQIAMFDVQSNHVALFYTMPPECKQISCYALESSDTYIYVVTASCEIIVYETSINMKQEGQLVYFTSFEDSINVKSMIISTDDKRAILRHTDDNLSYLKLDNLDKPKIEDQTIDTKLQNIISILFTHKNSQIFITSQDSENIYVFDMFLKMQVHQISGHAYAPHSCFLYENKRIVSFAKNELIMWKRVKEKETGDKTWKQQFLLPFYCKPVNSTGSEIAGVIYSGRLRIFTHKLILQFSDEYGDLQDEIDPLMLSGRRNSLLKGSQAEKVVKGPLNLLFPKILKQLQSEEVNQKDLIKYVDSVKANVIQPLNINMVHYFAARNNGPCIQKCFDLKMKYLRDSNQKTPLAYASEAKATESVEVIVDYLIKNKAVQENMTMQEVCQLIKDSPANLKNFFDNAYHIIDGSHIPKQGHIKGQPIPRSMQSVEGERIPMRFWFTDKSQLTTEDFEEQFLHLEQHDHHDHDHHHHSESFMRKLKISQHFNTNFMGTEELPILLKKINFKYDFETGSINSINFHQALKDCKEDDVFSSEVIQIILRYKWRKMTIYRNSRIFMLLMYIAFLFSKAYYESKIYKSTKVAVRKDLLLLGDIFFNSYFIILEVITIIGKWDLEGFKWGFILRFYFPLTLCIYVILDHQLDETTYTYKLDFLMLINLITWFKSITFLKFFTKTRIFIHLLKQVMVDIFGFLQICLYSTIMFTSCFFILKVQKIEPTPEDVLDESKRPKQGEEVILTLSELINKFTSELWNVVLECYQIIYGEFSVEIYDSFFEYSLFILSSIFLAVILLNIVIAIMSDTYERVMTAIVENDGRQQNKIILKKEAIMFWKRRDIKGCFLNSPKKKKNESGKKGSKGQNDEAEKMHLYWVHYQTEQKKPWKSQLDYIVQTITTSQRDLMVKVNTVINSLDSEKEARSDLEHQIMIRFDEGRRRQTILEQQISDLSRKFTDNNKQVLDKFTEIKGLFDKSNFLHTEQQQ